MTKLNSPCMFSALDNIIIEFQISHNMITLTLVHYIQLGAEVELKSKLETVNALYVSSKVKSLDSLLRCHDTSRSDVIGCDVIITPNPSYAVGPNSSETGKECEYQYDYVQTDDGSVQHDKVVGATTSGGEYDEVINPADNVNIDPNPSYSLPQVSYDN